MALAAAVDRSQAARRPKSSRLRRAARWLSETGQVPTLAALFVVLVGSAWAFAHVVEDYLTRDPLVLWDVSFAGWLHEHSSGGLVSLFEVLTYAGNSAVLIVVVGVLAAFFVRRVRANDGVVLILALGGAAVVNALLKLAFHRPRPEIAFVHLETYSFPSGHAAVGTATFATLAFLLARRGSLRRALAIYGAAVAVIAMIGFSRLYLGVHYLSDVLAGTSFGLTWASASLIAYTLYGKRSVAALLPRRARSRLTGR